MQRAYLLHARPYQESKLLVQLLSEHDGLIGAVVRVGTSKAQRANRAILQPFQPLLVELSGRSQLKTLRRFESAAAAIPLLGKPQYAGLYINEICVRLLAEQDPNLHLFERYHQSLLQLAKGLPLEPVLRYFEWTLLDNLGAAPSLTDDIHGEPLTDNCWYQLIPQQGFSPCQVHEPGANYNGGTLKALGNQYLADEHWPQAKILLRQLLTPLLGDKPLTSRQLFQQRKGEPHD
ncbi:DNA repair protein RecO [Paraferrimonas haliotis]|uniref:DNA repair protein RecO n=1 Tax=Paraferrimonas haliotis TaxID=2013866 RepID=A0AA37TQ44_9GAMM|nr:DNA repair protein RecO [Paraferrimonas haliotis]GLS82516.1 DNA repair protein RecO [Paraferrimonas haliotis]